MKIGVLTVYNSNFGSYFQAESLCRAIRLLGYNCEIINANVRYPYPKRLFTKLRIGEIVANYAPSKIINFLRKRSYDFDTYMSLRPEVAQEKISPFWPSMRRQTRQYDCVVVGSDELWSVGNPFIGYYPSFFGHEIVCPHIAYAVCGIMQGNPSEKLLDKMSSGLKSFVKLSARDMPTAKLVEGLTGNPCPIVLDPTLLNPYFASEGTGGGGYIIIYGQHYSQEQIEAIKAFAKEKKMKIKAVAWRHDDWCDEFIEVKSSAHLQQLFAQSEYCMPATFHGTIFSILNKRPFTAFMEPLRKDKVTHLLTMLGLEGRIFGAREQNEMREEIDYDAVECRLRELREYSNHFLHDALKQCTKGNQK